METICCQAWRCSWNLSKKKEGLRVGEEPKGGDGTIPTRTCFCTHIHYHVMLLSHSYLPKYIEYYLGSHSCRYPALVPSLRGSDYRRIENSSHLFEFQISSIQQSLVRKSRSQSPTSSEESVSQPFQISDHNNDLKWTNLKRMKF